jgi:O-antigen/teichoic acid export membrane protein
MSEDAEDEIADRLQAIGHGAVVASGANLSQKALLFFTNVALTRGLPIELYGVYALGRRISALIRRFGRLGSVQALVRFMPEYRDEPERRNRVLGLSYGTGLVASSLLGAGMFTLADPINEATLSQPALPPVLRLFAVVLILEVAVRLLSTLFRSLEMVEYQQWLWWVLLPGIRLGGVVVALFLGASTVGVVWAIIAATATAVFAGLWLSVTRTDVRPRFDFSYATVREFYNYAGPNAFSDIGKLMQSRVDVLIVGWLLTSEAAGVYNIALFLTSIIALPLASFNQLLPPIASDLYARDEVAALNEVYGSITRLVFTITAFMCAVALIYRVELLAVFGREYTRGHLVLTVFIVSRIVANSAGATGWLLLMTDHQYLDMVNSWTLGITNVALSYYFVVEFGLVGAALGTGSSLAFVNLLRLGQLRYLEGLWPYDRTYLKPVAAVIPAATAMFLARSLFASLTAVVVGTVFGGVVYLGGLLALGVEPRDHELVTALFTRYRGKM